MNNASKDLSGGFDVKTLSKYESVSDGDLKCYGISNAKSLLLLISVFFHPQWSDSRKLNTSMVQRAALNVSSRYLKGLAAVMPVLIGQTDLSLHHKEGNNSIS